MFGFIIWGCSNTPEKEIETNQIYFGGNYHNVQFFDCLDCNEESYEKIKSARKFEGYQGYYELFPSVLKAEVEVIENTIWVVEVKNVVSSY